MAEKCSSSRVRLSHTDMTPATAKSKASNSDSSKEHQPSSKLSSIVDGQMQPPPRPIPAPKPNHLIAASACAAGKSASMPSGTCCTTAKSKHQSAKCSDDRPSVPGSLGWTELATSPASDMSKPLPTLPVYNGLEQGTHKTQPAAADHATSEYAMKLVHNNFKNFIVLYYYFGS